MLYFHSVEPGNIFLFKDIKHGFTKDDYCVDVILCKVPREADQEHYLVMRYLLFKRVNDGGQLYYDFRHIIIPYEVDRYTKIA